jgi:hypothetical protein
MTTANKTAKRTWVWTVEDDGKGAFNACFDILEDGKPRTFTNGVTGEVTTLPPQAALSHVSREEAQAHVDMAQRHERENDERQALIGHLFNKQNWKMPTKRSTTRDLKKACAMRDALAHFCGGAEIQCLSGGRYSVGSAGYYHYVGA